MPLNIPNLLTVLRLVLIPIFVVSYYFPVAWANEFAMAVFIAAAVTDWLDGYLARKLNQSSAFGAFLDPVADKLMVAAALVMLTSDGRIHLQVLDSRLFVLAVVIIVGREIAISALREWMAELGKRHRIAVTLLGKLKTIGQMVAIPFLLYQQPLAGMPIFRVGEIILYVAAALTLWSLVFYLRVAWPELMRSAQQRG